MYAMRCTMDKVSFIIYFGLERAYHSSLARTGFMPAKGTPSLPSGDFVGVYKIDYKIKNKKKNKK